MNKEAIKDKLFELQENLVKELSEKINTVHSMVDIDESDTVDPEDFSHQYESGEMEQLMRVQMNKEQGNLEKLKSIDFGPKNTVSCGALVQTNQFNFLIGFATVPFEVDGSQIVGISNESPIYAIMATMKSGDSFSFRGNNYTIENII
jgi:hypothetical protein